MSLQDLRILCIPSEIGIAHLGRLLLIAQELTRQGYKLSFAYNGEHIQFVIRLGYEYFPVSKIRVSECQGFHDRLFDQYTDSMVERCVQDELEAIRKFKADLVIMDLRPTASISARIAGLPCISVL